MAPYRTIVVFLKFPVAGRVKTRLAAGLEGEDSGEQAATIYQSLVSNVLKVLSQSDFDELRVTYDPPEAEAKTRDWLKPDLDQFPESIAITFHPQSQGDLGDRLQTAVHGALNDSPDGFAAAIGTDCVEITPSTISETWAALEKQDLVFGPTFDGGYYLVGARSLAPEIFTDIPWSTEETLSESLKSAQSAGKDVALLNKRNDVDTVEDWERAKKHLGIE